MGSTADPVPERRLRGPNCTLSACNNAENLCGEFSQGCQRMGRVANGPEIWLKTFFEFRPGGRSGVYRRIDRGAVSEGQCLAEDFWPKFEYSGIWSVDGGSPYING